MIWQFRLIDSNNISTIVEEPVGWDGISCSFTRNMSHHGIFSNINTSDFEWVDTAYDLLLAEYNAQGANGNYQLLIEYECADGDGYTTYFQGKFDFNTLERQCLDYCFIKCSVTTTRCADIFLSRMGQDVNVLSTENFDGETIAPMGYNPLNIEGQDILLQNKANNDNGANWSGHHDDNLTITNRPRYYYFPVYLPNNPIMEFGDFNVTNVSPSLVYVADAEQDVLIFPKIGDVWPAYTNLSIYNATTSENIITTIDIEWRCKGTMTITASYQGPIDVYIFAEHAGFIQNSQVLGSTLIASTALVAFTPLVINFDVSFTGTCNNPQIAFDQLSFFFNLDIVKQTSTGGIDTVDISVDYDAGGVNYFNMEANSTNPTSVTDSVYLPNLLEWLPTAYLPTDCPTLEVEPNLRDCLERYSVTKGSMLRNVTEPSVPQLFTNYEFMFDQCRKIFNIGWGFNNNDTELSIANIEDFYQSTIIVDVGLLNKATFTTAKDLVYGTITIGYNKWEAEEYNGLDEMNTERQYRRNINSNPSELDLMSDIITAGYTIEVTRRKNQANTGTSDWRYDDDIFLINTFVDEGSLYAYRGASDTANMYSPSTRMNLRLTPVRNLMRWFKTLAGAQPTITNETLKFTSGTGNYLAESRFADQCFIETGVVSEQQNVISTDVVAPTPIWKTIYATFDAPLTMVQFEAIKTNVYGAIRFRCGNDLYLGNIVTLSHEPNTGLASFKLLLRR
jgi:hypothetical protein